MAHHEQQPTGGAGMNRRGFMGTILAAAVAPSWPPLFGGTGVWSHVPESAMGLATLFHISSLAIDAAWKQLHDRAKTMKEGDLSQKYILGPRLHIVLNWPRR